MKNTIKKTKKTTKKTTAKKEVKKPAVNKKPEPPKEKTLYTIFHMAEDFLQERYEFRYNQISKVIEIKDKPIGKWKDMNENTLYLHLQKSNVRISINNLMSILRSDFVKQYNPFAQYFENLKPWENGDIDEIRKLCSYISTPFADAFQIQFKKWLVRTVACAMDPVFFNKQAFILVQPKQNSGKSTFCRWLCPPSLSDYMAEDLTTDKDSRILLTRNLLINLDELSSLHKKELNALKAFFSKNKINERLPYDRKNSVINRCASFIGSTNLTEFLTDETGSVRWLCFNITAINWAYAKDLNIDKVWAQAYSLFLSDFDSQMTPAEIKENEKRNRTFQLLSQEQELVAAMFEIPTDDNKGEFFTATDVAQRVNAWSNMRVNKTMIGRALVSLGFAKAKDYKTDRYGYYAIFNKPHDLI